MGAQSKMMLLFFDESDTWGDPRIPLYEAVVRVLMEKGVAGATVLRGIMGFGAPHELHRAGLFGVSPDRPVTVICIDEEPKLRGAMPAIAPMIPDGLVFLVDGEVLHRAGGEGGR
jgi:PII-like signaling protein